MRSVLFINRGVCITMACIYFCIGRSVCFNFFVLIASCEECVSISSALCMCVVKECVCFLLL